MVASASRMTRSSPDARGRLPGTRLLAFARLWFEERTLSGVFEPLVGDWQRDVQAARTQGSAHWINLRWRFAFLATGVLAIPRLVAMPLPTGLLVDLVLRASLFGTLGFVLQQAFRQTGEVAGGAVLDSLPFALLPVVMRIQRSTELPESAARTMVLLCAAAAALVLAMVGGSAWETRAAAAAVPAIIALCGWRVGVNRRRWTEYSPAVRWWLTVALLCTAWALASYPIKNALGAPAGRALYTEVHYVLAILLAALIHVDDWRERRRSVR